jgi:hypothetical protein
MPALLHVGFLQATTFLSPSPPVWFKRGEQRLAAAAERERQHSGPGCGRAGDVTSNKTKRKHQPSGSSFAEFKQVFADYPSEDADDEQLEEYFERLHTLAIAAGSIASEKFNYRKQTSPRSAFRARRT